MNLKLQVFLLIWIIHLPSTTLGYEIATHQALSTEAAKASKLQNDPSILANLGLNATNKFKNTIGEDHNFAELISDGANFEDNPPRPANHFFDPLTGKGLAVGSPSPDWAIDGTGDSSTIKCSVCGWRVPSRWPWPPGRPGHASARC